jgi:hypothetical protein
VLDQDQMWENGLAARHLNGAIEGPLSVILCASRRKGRPLASPAGLLDRRRRSDCRPGKAHRRPRSHSPIAKEWPTGWFSQTHRPLSHRAQNFIFTSCCHQFLICRRSILGRVSPSYIRNRRGEYGCGPSFHDRRGRPRRTVHDLGVTGGVHPLKAVTGIIPSSPGGERHRVALHVVPVRHDVHRACCAACLADEAPADARPTPVLRQGIQPDVDPAIAGDASTYQRPNGATWR